ncbi:MarR family winged helix-turn-helix transcriptional regulator [Apibacter adventoris]|uniref:HTH-type transcriptional regulator SarZ n=1 Tax=Apibacter adventoris TaxID=1679466 RepID=A0A2S8A837_9FLAO|nr:MarR family transcriptional regulator [Apibacter adventoris]PQL90728.1 MarR family transcriptional regulator [Apibacter adventoris]PQL94446.1 MarR family transcriptional regulator [Apibacter adventoris]
MANNTVDKDIFFTISENDITGFLLWKVNNYWQREFKKKFEKLELTHSQLFLLFGILHMNSLNKEVTQKDISVKAGIDPMTTSTVLRTLQKKGWINRKYNKKDSRTKLISITQNGKQIIEEASKIIHEFNNSFFKPLEDKQKYFQNDLILLSKDELNDEEISKLQVNNNCWKNNENNN